MEKGAWILWSKVSSGYRVLLKSPECKAYVRLQITSECVCAALAGSKSPLVHSLDILSSMDLCHRQGSPEELQPGFGGTGL